MRGIPGRECASGGYPGGNFAVAASGDVDDDDDSSAAGPRYRIVVRKYLRSMFVSRKVNGVTLILSRTLVLINAHSVAQPR